MDAKLTQVEKLYGHYTRTHEGGEKRKLFAAMTDHLTAHFTIEERVLRARANLRLSEFQQHYLSARTYAELLKLEVGAPAFDAKLESLCKRLGTAPGNDNVEPATRLSRAA